ncbi:lipase/acylhydrolase, GDSL family [Thermacetogenium phaeum DSM 12270]|jgi:hypothetical protein|uniref:Lipase/acylhydrolase, GDSL family n=2 Tax=Thermacetogenium phaeum TaxID=85874 RepID=K4LF46_THEPS|nr:GDSL-type esterase/lipase family protein [Thermacetogenium phaeum]AFV10615.1 lipase/acylhydrolase, GDSL family [Thermacetogenium phaeum DSM 12270]KUK36430.1 MAG: Lipase/acylhydrolase, GDSL family [Thermacetogenium phaeum]MDK2880275.1 hypothetical protein [Clostridia bacterium]MDN5366349.1 hypothetical protein [Thermacetogenium sp.]
MTGKTRKKWATLNPRGLLLTLLIPAVIAAAAAAAGRYPWKPDGPLPPSTPAYAGSENSAQKEEPAVISGQGEEPPPAGAKKAVGDGEQGKVAEAPPSPNGKETAPPTGSGRVDYRTVFERDLFMGDSITEGLSFYEYLDEANVIAELGLTLAKAGKQLDRVAGANPERVFLLFGTNDISPTVTDEEFLEDYEELLRALQTRVPQARIYVQSLLPVSPQAQVERPYLNGSRIERLNASLKKLAASRGVGYLDLTPLIREAGRDLHEPDGIHLKRDFYPLWLNRLIEQAE